MARSSTSASWYRAAGLKPRLRAHTRILRQHFRGKRWYVLQDPASGRFHRFSEAAHFVIGLMDGRRTVHEIWTIGCDRLGDDNLTQDEMLQLLAQLHQADILHGDVRPDPDELVWRGDKQRRMKLVQTFFNPLAVRFPLFDPDRFLEATLPVVRPLLGWFGVVMFVVATVLGLTLAGMHWEELTKDIADRVFASQSLLLLVVTYPFIKALHELGHGYATKRWGGEVHEMGVMFLVFIPVPYVDASAAAAFRSKWQRAFVGAAGMIVEMTLAAARADRLAQRRAGPVRAFAFNVMLIGGVSTLLFNGNPLLRFDGYYVLSDLVEIPNLGMRSTRHICYLIQRYLFGAADAVSPVTARGEGAWFVFYGIASFGYRLTVAVTIISFTASKFFVVGVILAIWAVVMMYLWPLAKAVRFLFTSPLLRPKRRRALAVTGGAVAGLAAGPADGAGAVRDGRLRASSGAGRARVVNAGVEGIVVEILAPPNAAVAKGQALIRLEDPLRHRARARARGAARRGAAALRCGTNRRPRQRAHLRRTCPQCRGKARRGAGARDRPGRARRPGGSIRLAACRTAGWQGRRKG